jgi:site-specific DNA-methyltransferase (adenine-specific)
MIRSETIGAATLYLGDALAVMQALPSVKARALICDPPYCSGGFTEAAKRSAKGQGLRSETLAKSDWFGGDNMTAAGLQWMLRSIAVAFKGHALDESCTASFFADWRMVPLLATAIESAGLRFQSMPVWDKQAAGLGTGFRAQHECILHFSIDTPRYHSKSYGNVLRAPRMPSERDHPTEKPIAIMTALVDVQSEPGGGDPRPLHGVGQHRCRSCSNGPRFRGDRTRSAALRDRLPPDPGSVRPAPDVRGDRPQAGPGLSVRGRSSMSRTLHPAPLGADDPPLAAIAEVQA